MIRLLGYNNKEQPTNDAFIHFGANEPTNESSLPTQVNPFTTNNLTCKEIPNIWVTDNFYLIIMSITIPIVHKEICLHLCRIGSMLLLLHRIIFSFKLDVVFLCFLQRCNHQSLKLWIDLSIENSVINSNTFTRQWLIMFNSYYSERLEKRGQHELDKSNLSRSFCYFLFVHERCDGQSFAPLSLCLQISKQTHQNSEISALLNQTTWRFHMIAQHRWKKKNTCRKYSSSKHSTHGPDTSIGRTSLEISQALISIIFNLTKCSGFFVSKLSATLRNPSNISPWRAMSVAKINSIMPWER